MKKGCCKTKVEQQSFFLWWLPERQHHRGGNTTGAATPPGVTWEDTGSGEKEIERTSFRYYPLWLSGRQRRRVCCWWQPGAERKK